MKTALVVMAILSCCFFKRGSGCVAPKLVWVDQCSTDDLPEENGESYSWTTVAGAVVGAGVGIGVTVVAAPIILPAIGFGTGGVIAGSAAAATQSAIGNVVAGSAFATLQSVGAAGGLSATTSAVTTGATTVVGGIAGWLFQSSQNKTV